MEVFTSEDVKKLLWKKLVVVIGDSIQRCVYKDLVCLLVPDSKTRYLTTKELKAKGEVEFLKDKLLQGGQLGDVKTGINYREVRQYDSGTTVVKFYFVTRCYSEHLESVLNELKTMQPHAIIMNSCLWDLHRYGPCGPNLYRSNMEKLTANLKKAIPNDAIFIWNATLPLGSKCKGGFLLPYFENIPSQEIMEANYVASDIILSRGFIFLDLHSVFINQLHHRASDGIHWNHYAHRRISNMILLQLCRVWNMPVPRTMPLELPREILMLPPSDERHRSASFTSYTSHLHVDRFGFSSSGDARYVVQKNRIETPNSYKDRFRLIGSPINNVTNSTVVYKMSTQKPSPLSISVSSTVKKESGPFPQPMYSSSPIETNPRTKSILNQNDGTVRPGVNSVSVPVSIPVSEGHVNQHLDGAHTHSSLDEKGYYQGVPGNDTTSSVDSQVSKICTPYFSKAMYTSSNERRDNSLTASTNTVPQSSRLVIQVTASNSTDTNKTTDRLNTTCTSVSNPAITSHVSQLSVPVNQVMSSHVTKTTSCLDGKQSTMCVPPVTAHVSELNVPVNQVMSSKVTKTTHAIDEENSKLTPVTRISSLTQLYQEVQRQSSTRNETVAADHVTSCNTLSTTSTSVQSHQQKSTTNSHAQAVYPTTMTGQICQILDNMINAHRKTSNENSDATDSSKMLNKEQASEKSKSFTESGTSSKGLKRKASTDVEPKNQLAESVCTNTSGKTHNKAKKQAKKKTTSSQSSGKDTSSEGEKHNATVEAKRCKTSSKSHRKAMEKTEETKTAKMSSDKETSSRGQKRKSTVELEPTRTTKQGKVSMSEKKTATIIEDSQKPCNELKRKAPVETTSNENQQHCELAPPPTKKGKNEYNTSSMHNTYGQCLQKNGTPCVSSRQSSVSSRQSSTTSSVLTRTSIPVQSGNRIETINLTTQISCNPALYNCNSQGNYWMQGQQSLQDIQQQQLWFNTLLSRGRIGWRNNVQPNLYYNPISRSWQINQGYYYNNNYRY